MNGPEKLPVRLVLERPLRQPDGSGGTEVVWAAAGSVWAALTARSGREAFVGGQPQARVRYRILVRAAPVGAPSRPLPEQRFRLGARIFSILAVAEHGANGRYLQIEAEEDIA